MTMTAKNSIGRVHCINLKRDTLYRVVGFHKIDAYDGVGDHFIGIIGTVIPTALEPVRFKPLRELPPDACRANFIPLTLYRSHLKEYQSYIFKTGILFIGVYLEEVA
jgi:hypothetical protein